MLMESRFNPPVNSSSVALKVMLASPDGRSSLTLMVAGVPMVVELSQARTILRSIVQLHMLHGGSLSH